MFYNQASSTARGERDSESLESRLSLKRISVETLFKQRYNDRILATRDAMGKPADKTEQFKNYNAAVSAELQSFKLNQPTEYEALKALVAEMKGTSNLYYHGQQQEIQET